MLTVLAYRYPNFNTNTIRTFAKMCLYATLITLVFVGSLIVAPLILAALSAAIAAVCVAITAACVFACGVVVSVVTALVAFLVAVVLFAVKALCVVVIMASPVVIIRLQKELDKCS